MPLITVRINPAFVEKVKDKAPTIAKAVAYTVITGVVVASVAVLVERLSRTSDGGHDLSI